MTTQQVAEMLRSRLPSELHDVDLDELLSDALMINALPQTAELLTLLQALLVLSETPEIEIGSKLHKLADVIFVVIDGSEPAAGIPDMVSAKNVMARNREFLSSLSAEDIDLLRCWLQAVGQTEWYQDYYKCSGERARRYLDAVR